METQESNDSINEGPSITMEGPSQTNAVLVPLHDVTCRNHWTEFNIKTEGHLLLPKIAWFLSYLTLKDYTTSFLERFTWIELYIYTAKVRGCTHKIPNLRVMHCICT